jgi:hypothetical protein
LRGHGSGCRGWCALPRAGCAPLTRRPFDLGHAVNANLHDADHQAVCSHGLWPVDGSFSAATAVRPLPCHRQPCCNHACCAVSLSPALGVMAEPRCRPRRDRLQAVAANSLRERIGGVDQASSQASSTVTRRVSSARGTTISSVANRQHSAAGPRTI